MYAVITRVPVKPGKLDECLALFKETNPGLVADQPDWVEAKFTANRADGSITVVAVWKDAGSYRAYSKSDAFRGAMSRFAAFFSGPPEVSVNEILFEM